MDDVSTSWRSGAHSGLMQQAVASADGELPMVVWLRGDEPLCEDFSLDADAVMGLLGIRRSRLTQISGRELRVGRTRKGRYLTPVYRPVDVDAYRAWTRPTAAHQKSSSVLQEAADSLRGQKDELSQQMEHGFEHTVAAVERLMRHGRFAIAQDAASQEERLRSTLSEAHETQHETLRLSLACVTPLLAKFEALRSQVDRLAASQSLLAKELAELGGLSRLTREDATTRHDAVTSTLVTIQEALTSVVVATAPKEPKPPRKRRRVPRAALIVAGSSKDSRSAQRSVRAAKQKARSLARSQSKK